MTTFPLWVACTGPATVWDPPFDRPAGRARQPLCCRRGAAAPPVLVNDAPCQDVVATGDDVDLTALPIPFMHEKDGAPYISAGVAFADDPELGPNAGCYRLMFRTRREMAIDLFTASDLRRYYTRTYERKQPLPVGDRDRRACVRAHGARPIRPRPG